MGLIRNFLVMFVPMEFLYIPLDLFFEDIRDFEWFSKWISKSRSHQIMMISKLSASYFETNLSFLINGACFKAKYSLHSQNSKFMPPINLNIYLEQVLVRKVFVLIHYHCNLQNQSIVDYFLEVDSIILIWDPLEPVFHILMLVWISMVVFLFYFSNKNIYPGSEIQNT